MLEDRDEAIAKVQRMLKRDGIFVTSTVCLGDTMKYFKLLAPIGKFLGLMPLLRVFKVQELVASLTQAGFSIDYQWQHGKGRVAFIVARKTDQRQLDVRRSV